jgi:cytochrome c-type biogenesis protein CcmF
LQIVVNPLVDWIWLGFAVMALGTGIALLPERAFSFALAKLPVEASSAAAGTAALLLVLLLSGATVGAQMPGAEGGDQIRTSFYPRNDFEKQLQHEIVCTCGACGHSTIAECRKDPCGTSHQMRSELAALIDQHKTHDEIIQWFVTKYGSQEMLGAPINRGFNRLAWLVPYLIGAGGIGLAVIFARKWSSHPAADAPGAPEASPEEAELQARLNEELENME